MRAAFPPEKATLNLTGRYYRSIPFTDTGYEEEPLNLP